jgi:hypothetical protein
MFIIMLNENLWVCVGISNICNPIVLDVTDDIGKNKLIDKLNAVLEYHAIQRTEVGHNGEVGCILYDTNGCQRDNDYCTTCYYSPNEELGEEHYTYSVNIETFCNYVKGFAYINCRRCEMTLFIIKKGNNSISDILNNINVF